MTESIGNRYKEDLERLESLVNRYAQSRSLGLLLFAAMVIVGTLMSVALMHLLLSKPSWWLCCIVIVLLVWMNVTGLWLLVKVFPKYERCFYRKDGQIELEQHKVPIWASVAYLVTFLTPTVLCAVNIMQARWALSLALISLGVFMLYVSGKEKNRLLGVVFCGVLLLEAAATAIGVPTPFFSKGWLYSYFVALMIDIVAASLITTVVVHIYNRMILQKIKQMGPVDGQ